MISASIGRLAATLLAALWSGAALAQAKPADESNEAPAKAVQNPLANLISVPFQWTVPLGGGVGQIVRLGPLPVNLQLSAYYNVVRPDDGAEWQLRFQARFLLPKSIL